jgi:Tol biopolymer transport system component
VDEYASIPVVSPDGRSLAVFYKDDQKVPFRLCIVGVAESTVMRSFDLPLTFERPLHWTADGRGVAYIDTRNGVSNILVQPLDGGAAKPITDFRSDRILWFDISRDGKRLALARGTINNDVVLMSNFLSR